jgi:glycosyltransferase involved in cell wall biosynthesis
MAKITIVMTYWNRQRLLEKTLHSYSLSKEKDFNVLIIDNNSKEEIRLPKLPFEVKVIRLTDEPYANNYISAHNIGFFHAIKDDPKIIIITHSECYHEGDVISCAKKVTDDSYISFGCYSLKEGETPETVVMNQRGNTYDGDSAWYNHPVHRPAKHHFCSAITTKNLVLLNGFDERFCGGVAYDDDYFVEQIKRLGLRIEETSYPFVFHQWHYTAWKDNPDLIYRNRGLFDSLRHETDYRAIHLLSPDL